ncbi:MAG: energy-coupling factor transporter transmembrane component T family protein [Alphaproteobacteria bacterium]
MKIPFIEKGIHHLADVIKTGYLQWETASKDDFPQKIDARVKVLFLLFYVVIVSLKREIAAQALIGGFVFALALISRLNIIALYKRVLFWGFIFGFLIALPSAFNFITPGEVILPLLRLSKGYRLWVYQIPKEIGITKQGVGGVLMLTSRVMNSLALSLLVSYTTPFSEIIRALGLLRVPDSFLIIVTLSYKYMYIFAKTVEDMHLAKKSRLAGHESNAEARRWIVGRFAFLFKKTQLRCEEIFKAMVGRGFSDNIRLHRFRKLNLRDWSTGIALCLIGAVLLWI